MFERSDLCMFEHSGLSVDDLFSITEDTLDSLYVKSSETEQFYPFFHLYNEYFILKKKDLSKETAYVCYLISYYIFIVLTPPHSEEIALEFASEAVSLNPCTKYIQWLDIVKQGN